MSYAGFADDTRYARIIPWTEARVGESHRVAGSFQIFLSISPRVLV